MRKKIIKEAYIKNIILKIFDENLKQYGYRRIYNEIKQLNLGVSEHTVRKYMKKYNIIAEYVKKMRRRIKIRTSNENRNKYPDLINRQYSKITKRYSVLYTDVTYFIFGDKVYYKSTVIDGFTREIISSVISSKNDTKLAIKTLSIAIEQIKKIKDIKNTIIHSDHGVQYTSNYWKEFCIENKIKISMGAKKSCADNIIIESYHALLKKATIHNNRYLNIKEYIRDVLIWDEWYNSKKEITFGLQNTINKYNLNIFI